MWLTWLQAEGRGSRARVPGGALAERHDEAVVVGGEQLRADPARREDLEGRDRPDPVPGAAARAARQRARRRAPGHAVLPAHDRARLARHPQPAHPVRDRRARPARRPRPARPARAPRRSCGRCYRPPEPERGQRAPLLHRWPRAGMRCSRASASCALILQDCLLLYLSISSQHTIIMSIVRVHVLLCIILVHVNLYITLFL